MGPLDGIKVLDLSRNSPGRYTSMIMADFGANVITAETPRTTGTQSFMFTDDAWFRYVGWKYPGYQLHPGRSLCQGEIRTGPAHRCFHHPEKSGWGTR